MARLPTAERLQQAPQERQRGRAPLAGRCHEKAPTDEGEERVRRPDGDPRGDLQPERRALERRSEEHTSELQSRFDLVCRLLLEKKKKRASCARYSSPEAS